MAYCPHCKIEVKGQRISCPLCQEVLEDRPLSQSGEDLTQDSFPLIPLRYNQHLVFKVFMGLSAILLGILLAMRLAWPDIGLSWIHAALILAGFWSLGLALIRKRRNLAKSVLYQLAILASLALAWDYLTGWQGWSIVYAIPLFAGLAVIAILVTMLLVRYELGDYILYLLATSLIGILPLLLLAWSDLQPVWPAALSASLCGLVFALTVALKYRLIVFEIKVRFHI